MERISGVKIMKTKTFTKILSGILCSALTMQIGWGIKTKSVNAASVTSTETADGAIVNITGGQAYEAFDFKADSDGGIVISYTDDADNAQTYLFDKISVLNTYESVQMNIQSDITIDNLVITDGTLVGIDGNCSFTCSKINSNEWTQIIVEPGATFDCGSIEKADGARFILTNNSSVIIDSVDLSVIEYPASATSTISVLSSFTNGSDDVPGTVIADRYTNISNNGGKFTLQVGEATKEISETFSNKNPNELFDDPFSFGTVSDLYYGQDYDFSDLISVADGYDESLVYLEYSTAFSEYTTTKPTYPDTYYVRAVAPDYGTYLGKTSETQRFTISFLPLSELYPDGTTSYFTISGIVNGKYVPGDLVLTLPDGILFGAVSSPNFDGLKNPVTLTQDEILYDDHVNEDTLVQFRRASDNATTNSNISLVSVYPDIKNLIFDQYDPDIWLYSVDDEETDLDDNHAVTGDVVKINVFDENLKEIYINGSLYESYEEGHFAPKLIAGDSFPDTEDFEPDYVTLTLSSVPGEATDYTIKAVDYAGKETSYSFTFNPNTTDADISVSVPGTIFAGDDYSVDVKTNSDGEVSLQYKDASTNTVLSTKPTSAGKYTVTATAEETDFYYKTSASTSYTIIKRAPDTTVTVPDIITIDSDYAIEVATDSDGDITYQYYNKSNNTYPIKKPTTAGEYTVMVRTAETSKYYASEASVDYTISKRSPNVSLGVGTPYAGTTYSPTFYSNSDASDRAVFEYKEKNADDSKYSTTLPTAYGEYVVRVTIPETAEFAKTIVTADYRIIYLAAPQTAYVIEGQTGKNNYFISDVVLKAPTGYTISAVYGGPYTASIPYKDGITSVYLKRTSDNALTTAIPITNAPRVDKNAPSISAKTGTITPGAVMYASDFILNVSDPNLRSLKVNGEAVDLKNYKDGYTLTLNPGYGSQTYKIMAEDEAGNVTTIEFTLKAEWLKDKVIIPDVVLPLEGNESYNLGDGYWLVTRNTPEGPVTDNTVYSGNMPFYVNEGGDYTFTKVI